MDPDVDETGEPYAYAGDDPVDNTDPLGLCMLHGQDLLGSRPCPRNGPQSLAFAAALHAQSSQGGWIGGLRSAADFAAGIANSVASTFTLGHEHVAAPYCGYGFSTDLGYGYGIFATTVAGQAALEAWLGSAGAAEADAMAGVRATGDAGEQAAGIIKNADRIPSLSGTAAYRIPDELNSSVIGEVKNVSSLSYTNQLQDFAAYAQQQGLTFNLYVRASTTLSGPLQDAIDAGIVNLMRSLPG